MRRTLSILLSLVLAITAAGASFSVAAAASGAASSDYRCGACTEIAPARVESVEAAPARSSRLMAATELNLDNQVKLLLEVSGKIRSALLSGDSSVSLSGQSIPIRSEQFEYLNYFCPYIDGDKIDITMQYQVGTSVLSNIVISNRLGREATRTWVNTIDAKLGRLNSLIASAGDDPADQALVLHDYMAATYHYDETYASIFPSILLTEGKGVCQSYAYLFQYLMAQNGVKCYTAISDGLNHAWNIVRIGDSYYHVDVTWDDPVPDLHGNIRHDYFLISDSTLYGLSSGDALRKDRHITMPCSSNNYSSKYYRDAASPVVASGSNRYFVDSGGLKVCKTDGTSVSTIDTLGSWSNYVGKFSGLVLVNDILYYNTAREIRGYNLKNKQRLSVASPDTGSGLIYGLAASLEEGCITYSVQSNPNTSSRTLRSLNVADAGDSPVITTPAYEKSYVSSLKLTPIKAGITVKWRKQSAAAQKNFSGYELRYSTSKKMTGARTLKASRSSSGKTIKSLKRKKTYYVQVRTFSASGTSKWSPVKSARTK